MKKINNFIDDIIYGKDEDIFVRSARNRASKEEIKEKFGDVRVAAWVPGICAYVWMRDHIKNPELTKKEKFYLCAIDLGIELGLNAIRFGIIYGTFEFNKYLWQL